MRITNRIMQNNAMYNINQNKIKEDKYNTQMATNKKINRASEDPIVAIRALRLRSNVSELTQYYEKNSKDAESWLKVTEDALSTVTELLTGAIAQANKGANKELTTTDLSAIITEMSELADEYYATGNVDYGGRYVFTGYRTDTSLTFTDKTTLEYTDIHDGFNAADIDELVHITGVSGVDTNATPVTTEANIDRQALGRIRLSYDKLDEEDTADNTAANVTLKYRESFTVPATTSIKEQYDNGNPKTVQVSFTDGGTTEVFDVTLPEVVTEEGDDSTTYGTGFSLHRNSDGTFRLEKKSGADSQVVNISTNGAVYSSYKETSLQPQTATPAPAVITSTSSADEIDNVYKAAATSTDQTFWLNTDTGELILSESLRQKLVALEDLNNADSIEVTYNKSQWNKGDIRPENLFECTTPNPSDSTKKIHYNGGSYGHTMSYDVGYSQQIDVNTQASDVFTTDVKRSMDDLKSALSKLETLERTMAQIKANMEGETGTKLDELRTEYAAAQKAQAYLRQDVQDQLEHKITQMQKALDVANLAVTQNGMRSRRLELIQNRLQNQVTTFKTLQSDNEDIDMAETATNLMTAQTIYNASLQATGKISQNSLLDYV
ncbi:MAG: flagellar hook-associated protein FlgL [Lachnospiraceae bacterium]|nr:flagellar hook-associated protein FlgL [Lachnospiraceae bacterium]